MFSPQMVGKINRVLNQMAHLDLSQVNLLLDMVNFPRINTDIDGSSDWDNSIESRKNYLEWLLKDSDNPDNIINQWDQGIQNLSQDAPSAKLVIKNKQRLYLFASHLSRNQASVEDVANVLDKKWKIKLFVAHHDIKVGDDWIKDIEKALSSCDGGVIFLTDTDQFKASNWCSQEIGWLLGRFEDRILTLRFIHNGKYQDPWGFLGRLQGRSVRDNSHTAIADMIVDWCITRLKLQDQLGTSLVEAFANVTNWDIRNTIYERLKRLTNLDKSQVKTFLTAMRDNSQSWGGEDRTDPSAPPAVDSLVNFIIKQPGFNDDANQKLLKEAAEKNKYVSDVKKYIDLWNEKIAW